MPLNMPRVVALILGGGGGIRLSARPHLKAIAR